MERGPLSVLKLMHAAGEPRHGANSICKACMQLRGSLPCLAIPNQSLEYVICETKQLRLLQRSKQAILLPSASKGVNGAALRGARAENGSVEGALPLIKA